MNDSQATRFSLLVRLRDMQDTEAWFEFVEIYTPVVYGFLRKRGLQDADAADVTQDVFRKVSRSIRGFQCDRELGSFRGWLLTVTRNSLTDLHETRGRQPVGSADTAVHRLLEEESADDGSRQTWESEYRQSVFGNGPLVISARIFNREHGRRSGRPVWKALPPRTWPRPWA